jgi:hypothetical protein
MTRGRFAILCIAILISVGLFWTLLLVKRNGSDRLLVQPPAIGLESTNLQNLLWEFPLTQDLSSTLNRRVLNDRIYRDFQPIRRAPPTASVEPLVVLFTLLWARKHRTPLRCSVVVGVATLTLVIETRRQHFGTPGFLLVLFALMVLLRVLPEKKVPESPEIV